jgi:hypothetical protein
VSMNFDELHPTLREVAKHVERMQSAAAITDANWTLVWVSPELQWAMGADAAELGVGKHLLECYMMDAWCQKITEESRMRGFLEEVPYMIHDTPGGKQRILEMIRSRAGEGASPLDSSLSEAERQHIVDEIEKLRTGRLETFGEVDEGGACAVEQNLGMREVAVTKAQGHRLAFFEAARDSFDHLLYL